MTKYERFLLLLGPTVMSFFYAISSPVVHIYFCQLISPRVLAIADMISLLITAIVNSTIPLENMKKLYRKNFNVIVVIDIILYALISYEGLEYPEVRFIGFAILTAITTTLWGMIIRNAINRLLNGDDLTDWQAIRESAELWAAFIGALILVIIETLPIDLCIFLQCFGNTFLGIVDMYVYRLIARKAFKEDDINGMDR